jgi:hypothetical protein
MSIFDDIKPSTLLEAAAAMTLKKWMPTYLQELKLQVDLDYDLATPRSYTNKRTEPVNWPEEQLPGILVVCPGVTGRPSMEGSGHYRAPFGVVVGVINSANTKFATNVNNKLYAAAVRAIMVQKPSLGGVASGTEWIDESYDETPEDAERDLAVATLSFTIELDGVVNRLAGPTVPDPPDPDTLPGSEWPIVLKTFLDVIKKEEQ